MLSLSFLVTSLIVVLVPGTGVIYTISTGLMQGRRASLFAALGCTVGILPHLLAAALGLSAVLHLSAVAFQGFKVLGVAYLFYLAYATWRDSAAFAPTEVPGTTSLRQIAVKAFLINILNPKLTIFFLAFLPPFISPTLGSPMAQLAVLSAVFMAMTFVVFVGYGLLAHAFRSAVIESPRVQGWLRRSFAAAFAALGLNLALSDR